MKKLILTLPLLVCLNAFAAEPLSGVPLLIDIYSNHDYVCRHTPGMSPSDKVCKIRDEVADELNSKGWCYEGPRVDSPSYTYQWQECRNPPKKKSKVQELIEVYTIYENVCRGTPGMSPDDKVCKIRNELGKKLNKKGWCQRGPTEDSPAYTYTWQDCRDKRKP